MSDVAELVAFLEAQIAEDERVARDATAGPWRWEGLADRQMVDGVPRLVTVAGTTETHVVDGVVRELWIEPDATVISSWGHDAWGIDIEDSNAAHIALNDPAYVLADCASKRKIVEMHHRWENNARWCALCVAHEWPCPTLRALAQPFRGRDGWDEEWADE